MSLTRDKVIEALREACAAVLPSTPVVCAYLHGSVARNETHPTSDADVALFCQRGVTIDPVRLAATVAAELSRRVSVGHTIDCRVLDDAPLLLRFRAIQQGVLLYESDHNARCELESLIGRMFADWNYHLQRLSRHFIRQVARKGFGHG